MSLNINGLDQFLNDINKMTITNSEKERVLNKAVIPLSNSLKSEANSFRDTGELESSLKTVVKDGQAYVTSNKKHAWILEYSPKYNHMGWFSGAVEEVEDDILNIINDELFNK